MRQISRLSRVAGSIAICSARDNPARRGEEGGGLFLGCVEIGEQPARRGQFGTAGSAEAVERGDAEALLERSLARQAVEPALACVVAMPGHFLGGDGFGRR